jgi:formate dehydrogenase iron-sulfur subunit
MAVAILTDLTRCIGCRACVYACKEINGLPKEEAEGLSARTWTVVERRAGLNVRRQCMHCLDPACASVCPVAALHKTPAGPVVYEEDRCMGCRYCMVACPFHVPKYEWEKPLPRVQKCIFCSEKRLREGGQPACTEVCPAKATVFGDREALIQEARGRIEAHPGRYVNHVYGLEEAGGTSVLYLSSVPFERLGFPTGLDQEPYPRLTWEILSKIPNVVGVGGVLMCGIWWIVNRRMELQGKDALKRGHDRGAEDAGEEGDR